MGATRKENMNPIGLMRTPFKFKNGTPRQPTICSHARGCLTIDKSVFNNPEHSLEGLEEFSHVWILFIFHKNNNAHTKAKVKPPRLNGKKVGLFSTRSPYRPNNIGLSLAKLESVSGATIYLSGIDILDGTPVLDVKPYIPQYDCPSFWVTAESTDPELEAEPYEESEGTGDRERNDDDGNVSNLNTNSLECKEAETMKALEKHDCVHILSGKSEDSKDDFGQDITGSCCSKLKNEKLIGKQNVTVDGTIEAIDGKESVVGTNTFSDPNIVKVCREDTISQNNQSRACDKYYGGVEEQDSVVCVDEKLIQKVNSTYENLDLHKASSLYCDKQETKFRVNTSLESGILSTENNAYSHFNSTTTGMLKTDSSIYSQAANWISNSSVEKLNVRFTPTADQQLNMFSENSQDGIYRLQHLKSSQAREAITSILHEDPRSTYRRKNCIDSLYYFTVDCLHVTCWFDETIVEVVRIKPAALVEYCKSEYL